MGRPVKKGLDYFPTDVDFFEKEEIKFFSVECGASGICALMKLMCNIYRNGYYVEWSKDHEDLFALTQAETAGFEPACRLPDNLISSQARYGHFDTFPYYYNNLPCVLERVIATKAPR